MLHMWRRNPAATEALGHPSKLRASSSRVRVVRARIRASGHTHCERFVRDIGRFVAVDKVYWLARVARFAPAAPVGGLASVFRARTTASLISANYAAGRAAGVWARGAMRKARAVVMAGKLPSAVRSVGFCDCGRGRWHQVPVMRGSPGGPPAVRARPHRRKRAPCRACGAPPTQRARPPALATCAAWKALPWPLLEPADAPGGTLWYLGYSGYSISDRG